MAYIRGLKDTKRDREIPRLLIVSDFGPIALHDLELGQDHKRRRQRQPHSRLAQQFASRKPPSFLLCHR